MLLDWSLPGLGALGRPYYFLKLLDCCIDGRFAKGIVAIRRSRRAGEANSGERDQPKWATSISGVLTPEGRKTPPNAASNARVETVRPYRNWRRSQLRENYEKPLKHARFKNYSGSPHPRRGALFPSSLLAAICPCRRYGVGALTVLPLTVTAPAPPAEPANNRPSTLALVLRVMGLAAGTSRRPFKRLASHLLRQNWWPLVCRPW